MAADHLGQALSRLGPLKTYAAPPAERAALLRPPDDKADDVAVTVERVAGDAAGRLQVEAHGPAARPSPGCRSRSTPRA